MKKNNTNLIEVIISIILLLTSFYFTFKSNYEEKNTYESYFISNFSAFKMQNDDISCGPSCASMILDYYGKFHLYEDVRTETKTEWFSYDHTKYGFTTPSNIQKTLLNHKVYCNYFRGNLRKLENCIVKNKPVICLVRSGKYTWHYVVVIGYSNNNIYLANPSNGLLECVSKKIFYESWSFYGDLAGRNYSFFDSMILLLRTVEIYPNIMIV